MKYVENIIDLIGKTPLLKLGKTAKGVEAPVFIKMEFLNPAGSVKDRMASYIIKDAESRDEIKKSDIIVDNSSGNAAVAVSMVAANLGYKAVFAVADKTSQEKIDLIRAFGAEVIICPTHVSWDNPKSNYMTAYNLGQKDGYFYLSQYHSQKNVEAHYMRTGPEIWNDTEGKITHFVSGIGTGGTISGVGRYLKEKNPDIKIIGVDPEGSMFYDWVKTGTAEGIETYPCKVEGIGTDMVVNAFHPEVVDDVIRVYDKDSFKTARDLAHHEGILGGGSTGAHIFAALQVARELDKNAVVVTMACDSGQRYLTKMYSDEWMKTQGFDI